MFRNILRNMDKKNLDTKRVRKIENALRYLKVILLKEIRKIFLVPRKITLYREIRNIEVR